MSDLIKREDAIKAYNEAMDELVKWQMEEWQLGDFSECEFNTTDCKHIVRKLEAIPSADIPQDDDWEKYSDKLWKNAYERGKADGAMIYGNEYNCIMTIFGECSYAETGCGDCAVVEKVRKALSAERPQEWIPCSERLPKKYEQVLCCNKDGRVFSTALTYVHPEYKYWYFGKHRSVIAWMPLPKPWKGVGDDSDNI